MLNNTDFMLMAVEAAKKGYPAPNPRVGCVLVKGDEVLATGWHEAAGLDHAEVVALRQLNFRADGATAYVTLEPCNHSGRTGPCAVALKDAGVSRVVIGVPDPNPVAAGGADYLRKHQIEVLEGVCFADCSSVSELFLDSIRRGQPRVHVKAAISADGFMGREGHQVWLTGQEARLHTHQLRAELGAVLVGKQTVLVDNPQLTVRYVRTENQPTRFFFDPNHEVSGELAILSDEAPTRRIVAPGFANSGADIEVPYEGNAFDLTALLRALHEIPVRGLLVEGGPATIDGFWEAGLVDRITVYQSPKFLGSGIRSGAIDNILVTRSGWRGAEPVQLGDDLLFEFWRA